ncbi:MAG: DUF4255 domain-containing protein [Hellea sp.]
MIDHAVNLIAQRLNQHLKRKFSSPDDFVVVGGLDDGTGQRPEFSRDRLLLFVTNIAQDTTRRNVGRGGAISSTEMALQPKPMHLNISIMLASNFQAEKYLEGLKILSQAITYFQLHANFNPQNTPDMDDSITRLSLEICDLSGDNLSDLWGAIGGNYMPSILYLMRTVSIDEAMLTREDLLVTMPQTQPAGKA